MGEVHKITTGKMGEEIKNALFDMVGEGRSQQTRTRSDPLNIIPRRLTHEVHRNCFGQRVIKDWNKIPANIKASATAKQFKIGWKNYCKDGSQQAGEAIRDKMDQ